VGLCRPAGYAPRCTPSSDLVRIVAEHLPAFLEHVEQAGGSLPSFVTDELRGLLRCGDFEHGFLRFACRRCGDELRVPFSCKARGVCPSCLGRRMSETAAGWVDHLLPAVPYRQWVLSFRSSLSVRLGYDADALALVCRSLARHVGRRVRRNVAGGHGLARRGDLHPGLVTVVQRFRSDCGLYVHLHVLVADGAWRQTPDGRAEFLPLPELTHDDLHAVLAAVHDDLAAAGLDDAPGLDPSLLACAQLSLSTTASTPPRPVDARRLCVDAFDMSLHAATCVDGRDRKRLERLARYLLRPPFAMHAVSRTDDGRVRLNIGRQGRSVTMTPHQWLAKLAALVPPPKLHVVRYGGVFANRHHLRRVIAPTPPSPTTPTPPRQLALLSPDGSPAWSAAPLGEADVGRAHAHDASRHRRLSWARLLARVFSTDVTTCPCGGRLRPLGAVLTPDDIAAHLHGARAPPRAAPPGQLSLLP
jgi:hypothetical protein